MNNANFQIFKELTMVYHPDFSPEWSSQLQKVTLSKSVADPVSEKQTIVQ